MGTSQFMCDEVEGNRGHVGFMLRKAEAELSLLTS